MTRLFGPAIAVLALAGVLFGIGFWAGLPRQKDGIVIWSTGPTVTHIESLAQLVATKVSVSDVLIAEGRGYRGSWLIKGDGLVAIDLARAKVADVDKHLRKAKIVLPQPKVLSARVDHERTKTWSVEKTTWVPWGGDGDALRDQAMYHAQKLVEHAAGSADHIQQARVSAEKVIDSIYRMVDWEVTVAWEDSK
ncbi:MAG TPA: DUF4230 domain-containing protein [Gemmataceae bacterium]|jgi:hypothetical protein|nr:DUF4230 domain-containing protein [Gemmataceae bacterium]